ncbi:MAG: hypothetical protein CGW95_04780 [Phenylobacterium zucineum]|nr:MAG: hypothetical protein CGW95_04780 [Phenylobacterium zucineum]
MSGTLPTVRGPATASLSSVQPTRVSVSHSLKRQVRTRNAQRWAISYVFSPMLRDHFMVFYAFLIAQRGQFDTFTCTLNGSNAPRGSWAGNPLVNGASQTGRTISLKGFTSVTSGIAKAGDLIKFAGHSKVYMVTADAASDVSGNVTLNIEPALLVSPANNEAIVTNSVPFTVALASDNADIVAGAGGLAPLSINVIEVF